MDRLVFAMERYYVLCEVGTEFLNIIYMNDRLQRAKLKLRLLQMFTKRYAVDEFCLVSTKLFLSEM
jgi:hypothetical protein